MAEMFGPYVVVALVGQGSTGRVFRARHGELGRDAAVKELAESVRSAPGVSERLRVEAERLAGLSHPNIVALYDYVEEPGRAWLAEQWVDGASLERILAVHGRLSPEQALGAVRGAVLGLAHAHEQGLVHRDVSAGNILADLAGTSMLVDFGLAGPAGAGAAMGTPAFLSPEAARGEVVGKAADVYSVASVLFLLLSGQAPFPGSALESVRGHLEGAVPRLSGHGADLEDLLARSMSKDPGERPPDAAAFLAELEEAASRRYGAGWLERASIAGLVGSAMAGALAGAGGGAAGGAAQTVIFDATTASGDGAGASPPHALASGRKASRVSRRVAWATAGAATLVIAGGVVAVAVNGGDDPAPSRPASADRAVSPSGATTGTVDPPDGGGDDEEGAGTDPAALEALQVTRANPCEFFDPGAITSVIGKPYVEQFEFDPGDKITTTVSKDYACGRWGPASKKSGRDFVSQRPRGVLVYLAEGSPSPAAFARDRNKLYECSGADGAAFGRSGIGFSCRLDGTHGFDTVRRGWAARFGESTIYCAMVLPDEEARGRLPALQSLCADVIVAMGAA